MPMTKVRETISRKLSTSTRRPERLFLSPTPVLERNCRSRCVKCAGFTPSATRGRLLSTDLRAYKFGVQTALTVDMQKIDLLLSSFLTLSASYGAQQGLQQSYYAELRGGVCLTRS